MLLNYLHSPLQFEICNYEFFGAYARSDRPFKVVLFVFLVGGFVDSLSGYGGKYVRRGNPPGKEHVSFQRKNST